MSSATELARVALRPVLRGSSPVAATTWTMRLARMLGDELAAVAHKLDALIAERSVAAGGAA